MKGNGIPQDNLDSGKKKVLIVDDDPEIVELISDIFSRDPRFEIATASSGYDAGVMTGQFKPDIILLDYMLPDVNGNIVCQTIKQNPDFEDIKIIIVSGVVKQDEIDQLLKSGAEGFVKKPFDIDELVNQVCVVSQLA